MDKTYLILQLLSRDLVTSSDPTWIQRDGGDPRGYFERERDLRNAERFNRFWDWQMEIERRWITRR